MKPSLLVFSAILLVAAAAAHASCPEWQCYMHCEYGFKRDAAGCDICECQELACRDVSCVEGKVCEVYTSEDGHYGPEAQCVDPRLPDRCKHPMEIGTCSGSELRWFFDTEYDECQEFMYSGCHGNDNQFETRIECDTECNPELLGVKPGCSPVMCLMMCPNGFEVDENGCQICRCRLKPALRSEQADVFSAPAVCGEDFSCDLDCQFGFRRNDLGCHVCECHVPPHCIEAQCTNTCPYGRKFDDQGCETCGCRAEGECRELTCRMFCEYGYKEDVHGCPHCECNEQPCRMKFCPEGTFCKVDEEVSPPTAACVMEDAWNGFCPEIMCDMYCEHSFKTDVYGCDKCECRDRPAEECPMHKCVPCRYGYAVDEQGCRGCDCLPDPCEEATCVDGQICEATRDCIGSTCRHSASCTDESDIRRAHIDMTLIHPPVPELDTHDFQREFHEHISDLLGVDETSIKGVRVSRKDNHTLVVDFHIVGDGSRHLVEKVTTFRSHLDIDMHEATLQYGDVDFIPQPESLVATYHSTGYDSTETAPASSATTVIIIACVVAGMLLLVLISVVVAKIMRNKKPTTPRKNIIYKKAHPSTDGTTDQMA